MLSRFVESGIWLWGCLFSADYGQKCVKKFFNMLNFFHFSKETNTETSLAGNSFSQECHQHATMPKTATRLQPESKGDLWWRYCQAEGKACDCMSNTACSVVHMPQWKSASHKSSSRCTLRNWQRGGLVEQSCLKSCGSSLRVFEGIVKCWKTAYMHLHARTSQQQELVYWKNRPLDSIVI